MKDSLGDRMKSYEVTETGRKFMPLLPVYARMDGRCFSKFTHHMKRPYDEDMSRLMIEVTKHLVRETNACVGYTQSDEISLAWYQYHPKHQFYFDGRIQKMVSNLASETTSAFTILGMEYFPEHIKKLRPTFDARVFQLPNLEECKNAFLWREWDATKNSITMAAQSFYSHDELMGVNGAQKQDMLIEKGQNWNDYPDFFKRGTYIACRPKERTFTEEEWLAISEKHRPTRPIFSHPPTELNLPPLGKIENAIDVLFYNKEPIMKT